MSQEIPIERFGDDGSGELKFLVVNVSRLGNLYNKDFKLSS